MYQQDINTILDSPPSPKIQPKQEPMPDMPELELELETESGLLELEPEPWKQEWDLPTHPEVEEMVDEQEEEDAPRKRTFGEFSGFNKKRPNAFLTLSFPQRRVYKIRHI